MKAVLVGNIDGKRLYYIIDCKSRFSDGIIASNQSDAKIIDFWPTVKSAESLIPITNTLFHEILWGNNVNGDKELWHSCFVSKRFPIDNGLLDGVVIREDIFNKKNKLNTFTNRAIEFKSMLSSQNEKGIIKIIGERIGDRTERATGRVRGFRAGATFDPNAVDADMDGFVQEGTQFARPAIPGVNTNTPDLAKDKPIMEAPKRSKIRSVGESLKSTTGKFHWFNPRSNDVRNKTRWIDRSSKVIDSEFEKQTKTLEDTYNNGKKIQTIGDAKNVLSKLSPKTNIDFIRNSTNDSDDLTPFQQSLFLGIAHGIHIAPQLQSVRITVKEHDPSEKSQGSQRLVTPIFGASGKRIFQVSRRAPMPNDDRSTRESGHIIMYAGESHNSTKIRGGRISPSSGRYQPGIFETSGWDLTSFRVAASYLFEEQDDPDYKKFKELADRIEKIESDIDPNATQTEELQKEYQTLKQIFEKAITDQSSSPDLDKRIEAAKLAMMRAVMIHELGHAAHQEAAYQDAIKNASDARDAHVVKYRTMLNRKNDIAKILKSGQNDQQTIKDLQDEAAVIDSELSKLGDMASIDYLDELENSTGPELFPFYIWHEFHGGGDRNAERKIAETILDRQAARTITDLLSPFHGAFSFDPIAGEPDLVPESWLIAFQATKKAELEQIYRAAMATGNTSQATMAKQLAQTLDQIVDQVTQNSLDQMNNDILDKSGKPIRMTSSMAKTLDMLRGQSDSTKGFHQATIQALGEATKEGENIRMRDLLDFVALGSIYLNKKLYKGGGFDPDIGVNSMPHSLNPEKQGENISIIATMIGNNFESLSDVASVETRTKMSDAIRRLGLINTIIHPSPFSASDDLNDRLNTLVDSTSIQDTFAGSIVPNPLDSSPTTQYNLVEEALQTALKVFSGDRQDIIQSENAGTLFMMAAVARHSYDDLTDEERSIVQKISRYGGGQPQAAYMSLITNIPMVELLKDKWGENRAELFSELAVINALQLTLYSGDKDKDGNLVSRHLSEREREVIRKLLSWYQNKAEFHLGSASLPKDR